MRLLRYGGELLHDPRPRDDGRVVSACTLSAEANKSARLTVRVPPANPLHGAFEAMRCDREVVLEDDGEELFRGRVLNAEVDGEDGSEVIVCEDQLAYLNDSVVRPYGTYANPEEGWQVAPGDAHNLFEWYIRQHNAQVTDAQAFEVGVNEVPSKKLTRSSTQYPNTGAEVKEKLLDHGVGYVRAVMRDGRRTVDFLEDGGGKSSQRVMLGSNLLSYSHRMSSSGVVTAIVAESGDITLEDVPDGAFGDGATVKGDRIQSNAGVGTLGVICEHRIYDADTPRALAQAAYADLMGSASLLDSIEVGAVDLHRVDPSVPALRLYDWVRVTAEPFGIDQYLMVVGVEIDATRADGDRYMLGSTRPTLTDAHVTAQRDMQLALESGIREAEALTEEAKAAARDAAEASGEAAEAAASKRRVFVQQPWTPYDEGDLWRREEGGRVSIMTCVSARASGEFDPADWELSATDDGAADAARDAADAAQTAADGAQQAADGAQQSADAAQGAADAARDAVDEEVSDRRAAQSVLASCSTAADAAAKVAVPDAGDYALVKGVTVHVRFEHGNAADAVTLRVGGDDQPALPVWYQGAQLGSGSEGNWSAGSLVGFAYDGERWVMLDAPGLTQAVVRIEQTESGLESEVSARRQTDAAVTELTTRVEQTESGITSEATARQDADAALSSRINQNADAITSEVSAREQTDADVTALSTRVRQTESDVTTAISTANSASTAAGTASADAGAALSAANATATLIRQYEGGVLVCRQGNDIGALVNADGSFDVVGVSWSGSTPTKGSTTYASFGSTTVISSGSEALKLTSSGASAKFIYAKSCLKYAHTLYVNNSSTNGSFTLNESIRGYTYVRIDYYSTADSPNRRKSAVVYKGSASNIAAPLTVVREISGGCVMTDQKVIQISGSSATVLSYGQAQYGAAAGVNSNNTIYVERVTAWIDDTMTTSDYDRY